MNNFAKLKLYLAAGIAAAAAGLHVLGYDQISQTVTVVGSALLAALGLNAVGQGLAVSAALKADPAKAGK